MNTGAQRSFVLCLGIALLLGAASSAWAELYTSPTGYTVQIPDGWTAVSIDNESQLPDEMRQFIQEQKFDLKQIDLMVLAPMEFGQVVSNFNVVVTPGQIPVWRLSVEQFTKEISEQYAKIGVKVSNLVARKVNVAGREAFEVNYESRMPWADGIIRQRQIVLPGGGRTFTVTFTSHPDRFDQELPTFEAVQQSLTVPVPTADGGIMNGTFRGGLIGGIAGGLGAALFMLFKKKQPAPTADEE